MAFRPPVKQRNDTIAYTKKSFWNENFLVNQSDSGEQKERINKLFIGLR